MMRSLARGLLAACLCLPTCLRAEEAPAPAFDAAAFEASLQYQQGRITLPNGRAELDLGSEFRYLAPADTARVLTEAWGNPEGALTQGMIVPADVSPLSREGWGVIVEYEDSGHVSDADAQKIDYDALLADMQQNTRDHNKARAEAGYPPIELVGWASKPFYEAAGSRLHWAKELRFGDEAAHVLNYDVRVLGREGVLVLSAVAGMNQFAAIRPQLERIVQVASFTPGHRYADYNAATDRTAEYGLAALVAGGVAAKAGWLAPLLAFFKKFIVLAVLGLVWLGKKLLGRRQAA